MTPARFRSHFPAIGERVYLNSASEGLMPEEAISAGEKAGRKKARPWEIGRDEYYAGPARVRARIEALVGAPSGSVALVPGTSAGIGIAARGLPLGPGDEVLLLEGQFPSNANPWGAARSRGAVVRAAPRPGGADPTEALLAAIGPRTRAVSIDWVSFVDGAVADLEAIGSACRERGAFFVVDAAQGLGALTVAVERLGIDLLAAPAHKWLLGPVGCGFVAVRPSLLDALQPWNAGWVNLAARTGFRNVLRCAGDPPPDATRFETGSPPIAPLAAWDRSLDLIAAAGPIEIERRVLTLASRLARGIRALAPAIGGARGLEIVTPADPDPRGGIVSFRSLGEGTVPLYRSLEEAGITVALREGLIRAAPHAYNTEDEIDRLLDALGCGLG
jgi:selenocysteine lyase/cysteine desulfurase